MRRWRLFTSVLLAVGAVLVYLPRLGTSRMAPTPQAVPEGDQEIAWLNTPTAFEAWENFVWGVKRAEMAMPGAPDGLEVDDSRAFPTKTTSVPELIVRRRGFQGSLRIRWYRLTEGATQEDWVRALAERGPAPLAILGGWSSDRAKNLADAMRDANWKSSRPLLFFATATADRVDPDENDETATIGQGPNLISIYDRSFRFCFTNRQMADSVTDFVLSDPTLRPGPVTPVGSKSGLSAIVGAWVEEIQLAAEPLTGFTIEWKDDPYSTDLSYKFREAFREKLCAAPSLPQLIMTTYTVPFSTGRFDRPNPAEAQVAEHILDSLPEPGSRTILIMPTVTAPARRTLRTLVQGDPSIGRRLVAVTGDGISVNTLFRDREFAWPVRSIPVPLVLFTHGDPFGWDAPGSTVQPPPGYALIPPKPDTVRSSTEEIKLYTRFIRVVASASFPDQKSTITETADGVAQRLRSLQPPFFDSEGNRMGGTGEHVVVLRPYLPGDARGTPPSREKLEVYIRESPTQGWRLIHSRSLSVGVGGEQE
jgi:hypothetical protein